MIKASINQENSLTLDQSADGTLLINGNKVAADIKQIKAGSYHLIVANKSYTIDVIDSDRNTKKHTLRVNGKIMEVQLKDRFDELLKELGIDATAGKKVGDLKAPMPGLVVEIPVEEGQKISKGDTLLILEAMKMENSLKAIADGVVKKVMVKKGQAVDKNQVLIQLG
jgi:biotin carboxyl carrier protein